MVYAFLCAVVWVGDTAAMYVGKSLGYHKMAPAISPGKTWEGAIGCVVGGVCTAGVSAGFGCHIWDSGNVSCWDSVLLSQPS